MPKRTVYLDDALDTEVQNTARATGRNFAEIIRRRVREGSREDKFDALNSKTEAIFSLLEFVAGEIGFIAGATRSGTKTVESALKEGGYYEHHFRTTAKAFRRSFERLQNPEEGN